MSASPVQSAAATGVSLAILNEKGDLLPTGEKGEVCIKGPNVIQGYENNPQANVESFTNGWFRTGDEGYLDADGYLTLTGRIKELINRGGEKISPREIDEVLLMHPAVAEVVCFAMPDRVYGEEVAAAVVLNGAATEAELAAHCNHCWPISKSRRRFTSSRPSRARRLARFSGATSQRRWQS